MCAGEYQPKTRSNLWGVLHRADRLHEPLVWTKEESGPAGPFKPAAPLYKHCVKQKWKLFPQGSQKLMV